MEVEDAGGEKDDIPAAGLNGGVGEGGKDGGGERRAASETDCILTTHYGYY